MKDDRTDAPSPPARPPQSPVRQYPVHRRRHRSREQDCFRQPSHRGFPATASTAPDPPLQRSASSIPPQNHQENLSSARVFTQPGSRADLKEILNKLYFSPPPPSGADAPGAWCKRPITFESSGDT